MVIYVIVNLILKFKLIKKLLKKLISTTVKNIRKNSYGIRQPLVCYAFFLINVQSALNIHIDGIYRKAKCTCYNVTNITQMSFHCGHIIA